VLKSLHFSSEEPEREEEKNGWKEQWENFIEKAMLQTFIKKTSFQIPPALAPFSDTGEYALFSAACRTTSLLSDARDKFPKTIKVLFDGAFEKLAGCGRYYDDDFQFIAVAAADVPKDKGEKDLWIAEKLIKPCVQIVKNIRQYYDVHIFIGVSSHGKSGGFERLVEEAHKARINCFFSAKLFVDAYDPAKNTAAGKISQKGGMVSYAKLTALIDSGQKEAMLEYIQNIFRDLRAARDYAEVYDAFIDFLSVAKLIHGKFQLEKEGALSENKFMHNTFFDLPFIGDVEMYIYELYLSLLSTTQNGKTSYSHIVKKCIDFIHSDYESNIGLAEAAVKAGVSHSYLSFIFKQETGINFNAALAQYRIEKAKKLLLDTNLRIYQVAGKVGFSNPYYFSKVFREIAGCTCKEYRDMTEK
jgi:two-component system response regulator YesN